MDSLCQVWCRLTEWFWSRKVPNYAISLLSVPLEKRDYILTISLSDKDAFLSSFVESRGDFTERQTMDKHACSLLKGLRIVKVTVFS